MKNLSIYLLLLICAICYSLTAAQDDGAAAPVISPAKRIAALRRSVGKPSKPTTTTTAAPPAQSDGDDADYKDELEGVDHEQDGDENAGAAAAALASTTTTTTTEAPKKIGPVIRPFRSNDDFLNSLKRRQQNAKKHRAEKPTAKPSKKTDDETGEHEQEAAAPAAAAPAVSAPSKSYKSHAALGRRKPPKSNGKPTAEPANDEAGGNAEESEQQKEETKPKRLIGGRLPLRKRN